MTYDELVQRIGEPQGAGIKVDDVDQSLTTVFHWACGCRAYEWPDHIEIDPCFTHRGSLGRDPGE